MLRKYICYLTPGSFFPNEHIYPVEENKPAPKNCFGFYTFEITETVLDGELLTGSSKNKSGTTYYGRRIHIDEIAKKVKDPDILISNVKQYSDYAVLCVTGNFRPLLATDSVIDTPLMAGVAERVFK